PLICPRTISCFLLFSFARPRPPRSTLFPYTTLFRSGVSASHVPSPDRQRTSVAVDDCACAHTSSPSCRCHFAPSCHSAPPISPPVSRAAYDAVSRPAYATVSRPVSRTPRSISSPSCVVAGAWVAAVVGDDVEGGVRGELRLQQGDSPVGGARGRRRIVQGTVDGIADEHGSRGSGGCAHIDQPQVRAVPGHVRVVPPDEGQCAAI